MLAVVFGRFLGVLILVPGRYLIKCFVPGISFLLFGSCALLVRALLVRALLVRALLVRALLVRALLFRALLFRALLVSALLVRALLVLGIGGPGRC